MSQLNGISPAILQSLIGSLQAPRIGVPGNNPIAASFAQLMNQANQANATRGQGILELLQNQGQQQLQQNQQNYQDQLGNIQQSMLSKGLANTTVGDNLNQGAADELAFQNEGVNEKTAQGLAGMANSFTQRAPDMGLLAQLLQRGGGGGGGGGIINGPQPMNFWPVGQMQQNPTGQGLQF